MEKNNVNTDLQYRKGYVEGYRQAVKDITEKGIEYIANSADDSWIEILPLKKRTIDCLHKAKIYRISELLALNMYAIWALPGIGPGSRKEIAQALYAYGVLATDWSLYL